MPAVCFLLKGGTALLARNFESKAWLCVSPYGFQLCFASISDPAIRSSTEGAAPSSPGRHGPPAEETGRHPLAVATYGALWWRGEEDQHCTSLAVLFFRSWLWVFDFLWEYDWCDKKIIKKETWLPGAKGNHILLRSLVWMASAFSVSFPVFIRMRLEFFFPLLQGHGAELDSTCYSGDIPINLWLFACFFPSFVPTEPDAGLLQTQPQWQIPAGD